MTKTTRLLTLGLWVLAFGACSDDGDPETDLDGVSGAHASPACPGASALSPLAEAPTYAVVMTDFASTAIAVLDANGDVLDANWINSGTTAPGLVAALSGDVVLSTQQAGDGTLTILDRLRTDVVSRFCVPDGTLIGQVRTQGTESGEAGFSSNPQDVLFVDATSAWVTRHETNVDPSASPIDRGNDLFEFDPTAMTTTGRRLGLDAFNTTGTSMTDAGPVQVDVLARPAGVVSVSSGKAAISLARLSADFTAAGPGLLAIFDAESEMLSSVPLGDMKNCGRVVPVPSAPDMVAVSCTGFAQPFGDSVQVRASSGVACVRITADDAQVVETWRPSNDAEDPLAVSNIAMLDSQTLLAVQTGSFDPPSGDRLYRIDIGTGAHTLVFESSEAFAVGSPAFDAETGLLLVPDSAVGVRRFRVMGEAIEVVDILEISPGLGLPARQVYRLN